LKQQALCNSLKFPNTVLITGKQIFLLICHGSKQFFFIPADQTDSIPADGKFTLSEYLYDLSAVPTEAEVYMYYVWQSFLKERETSKS